MAQQRIIEISELQKSKTLYPRVSVSYETVLKYAYAMRNGNKFPPIIVGLYEGKKLIIDGIHRVEAYKKLNKKQITAVVKEFKTERDLFIESVRLNNSHGKPYGKDDVKKIVLKLKKMNVDAVTISNITCMPGKIVRNIMRVSEVRQIHNKMVKSDINTDIYDEVIRDRHFENSPETFLNQRFSSFHNDLIKIRESKKIISSVEKVILLDIKREIDKIVQRCN